MFPNKENSIRFVIIEILSFRQRNPYFIYYCNILFNIKESSKKASLFRNYQ